VTARTHWEVSDYFTPPLERVVQLFPYLVSLELHEETEDEDIDCLSRLRNLRSLGVEGLFPGHCGLRDFEVMF
jgi:hypothetical protein